jgi:cell division protein FtsW (lipid II flippase)
LDATSTDIQRSVDHRERRLLGLAFVFLVMACLALTLAPAVRLGSWALIQGQGRQWLVVPVWLACSLASHLVLRRRLPARDPFLFPVAMLLAGWGLILIWRLAPAFGLRQTAWLAVAVAALLIIVSLPIALDWLRRYRYLWLSLGLLLTALTLIFGTNPSGGLPRLWLGCCGIYFQPSEILRLLLVIFMASYLGERIERGWRADRPSLWAALMPLLIVWGVALMLLVFQRDLGSGLISLAVLAVLLYLASGRWEVLLASAGLAGLGALLAAATSEVVQARLQSWLDPWGDPLGGSYQVVQSLISTAAGGVFGRGPGLGAPSFVPVAHSDFIFAGVTEEWGVIGATAMLALLAVLVGRGLRIAIEAADPFRRMLAGGITVSVGLQAIIIVAGVLRILPLTGVTLPFVSYGGSSLVASFLGLGLLLVTSHARRPAPGRRPAFEHVYLGMGIAIFALALAVGYWGIIRADALVQRTDNPRRALAERFFRRGTILDRSNAALAVSEGVPGTYQRLYPSPEASAVIGFDSAVYGLIGVEKEMDRVLRGEGPSAGFDALWSYLLYGHAARGSDVRLTLDANLQRQVSRLLEGQRGAALILDPASGDVLALASSPSYDSGAVEVTWEQLVSDENAPLIHRGLQASYQPGMAIGPWIAAWGEGVGAVPWEDAGHDSLGSLDINGATLSCGAVPEGRTDGIPLGEALALGCPGPLAHVARAMGAEEVLGAFRPLLPPGEFDNLQEEMTQRLAEEEAVVGLAVGQSSVTLTLVEAARAFSAAVGDGALPEVRLVDAVRQEDGSWQDVPPLYIREAALEPAAAARVQAALSKPSEGTVVYLAQAVAGEDQGTLAWFLGRTSRPYLVAVILEDSLPSAAEQIGSQILNALDDVS